MLHQFRNFYPQGSLISELINIDRGLYIVKVTVQDKAIVLGTGLAAADTIEKAEDKARERALMILNLADKSLTNSTANSATSIDTAQKIPLPQENRSNNSPVANNSQQTFTLPKPVEKPIKEDFFTPTDINTNTLEVPEKPFVAEPQTNIFDQPLSSPVEETIPEAAPTIEIDFNEIKHKTDLEMKRLKWTKEQGIEYLLSTYGKKSRLSLSDSELLEFLEYLENLPS